MSMDTTQLEGEITSIDITPLVDIILVLLIIFMVATPLMVERALEVNVPAARHSEAKATRSILIQMDAKERLFLQKHSITRVELQKELTALTSQNRGIAVSVAVDRGVSYGKVVGLLDLIRGTGVKKLALDVKGR